VAIGVLLQELGSSADISRVKAQIPPTRAAVAVKARIARRRRKIPRGPLLLAGGLISATLILAGLADTGIGATSLSDQKTVTATVASMITLTDPVALDSGSAADVTWSAGSPDVLNLGEVGAGETTTASFTYRVTTTSPTGYTLQVSNVGSAPLMQGSGGISIPDMGAAPAALVTTTSAFGLAAGDKTGHNQASVNYAGTPWGTTGGGGTQGTLYRGIPVAGATVAQQAAPSANDPTTLNLAAINANNSLLAPGAYTGLMRVTPSAV
jgi:hypothetical protein